MNSKTTPLTVIHLLTLEVVWTASTTACEVGFSVVLQNPNGSLKLIGLLAQKTYWFSPPLIPKGSLESHLPVIGSYQRARK